MPLYLGSFAGGLFQGAQSAMSLYTQFQGISAQMRMQAEKDAAKEESRVNANIPGGWDDYTGKPAGVRPLITNLDPSAVPETGKPATGGAAGGGGAAVIPASATVAAPAETPVAIPGALTSDERGGSDPYRPAAATGLPRQPFNAAGIPGLPGSPSGPAQYPPPATPPAPPAPVDPNDRKAAMEGTGPVIWTRGLGLHRARPGESGYQFTLEKGMRPFTWDGTSPAEPAPASAQPAEPVQGAGPRIYGYPRPQGQEQPPIIPPPPPAPFVPGGPSPTITNEALPPEPPPAPVPPVPGPMIQLESQPSGISPQITAPPPTAAQPAAAPAQGASLGRSIWNAIIPSAEAAIGHTGQTPVAAAEHPAPAAPAPAPAPAAPAPAPAAPAAAEHPPATGLPAAATAPATPATAEKPTAPAAAPVPVEGGKVAPGKTQVGKSQQSGNTPVPMQPPPNLVHVHNLQATRPDVWDEIVKDVQETGGSTNGVTPEQMAAVVGRESTYGTDQRANGNIMQVLPAAQADVEKAIGRKLDMTNWKDSVLAGVVYQKILGNEFGGASVQANLAYRVGPEVVRSIPRLGMDNALKVFPHLAQSLKDMEQFYDKNVDVYNASYYNGGNGGANRYDIPAAMRIVQQEGPDGMLKFFAQSGAPGTGMSEHWRAFQSAAEDFAIWSGKPENIPHVIEWVAQLSHQGAVSNLIAADQALLRGDPATAAGLMMRSHAFFPDGSYARAGTDKKGNVWVEQFSEATGERLGKPFQVNHEMIAQQVIGMLHPGTYTETLQKHQLNNADIILKRAHAQAYADLPQLRRDLANQAAGVREDAIEERREAAKRHDETQRLGLAQKAETAAGNIGAASNQVNQAINKQQEEEPKGPVDPETNKPLLTMDDVGKSYEVQRAMMLPQRAGGAEFTLPHAKNLSQGMLTGRLTMQPGENLQHEPGYQIKDAKSGEVLGYISMGTAARIFNIPGLKERLQPAAALPPPGTGQKHSSAVGAGLGSYSALAQGYNQNLSGLPIRQLPQQQQSMVG